MCKVRPEPATAVWRRARHSEYVCAMASLKVEDNRLVRRFNDDQLWIEPWGRNGLRVRATRRPQMDDADWALLSKGQSKRHF